MKHPHLLLLVELAYFVLFLPLMFIPVIGWGILIALNSYKWRLEHEL